MSKLLKLYTAMCTWDFPGSPVGKTHIPNAGGPGWERETLHAKTEILPVLLLKTYHSQINKYMQLILCQLYLEESYFV